VTQPSQPAPDTSRRAALAGIGLAGLAGLAATLTACGGSSGSSTGSTATGAASGTALGPASDVPVGGGKVFASAQVVVTQPSAGEYKAFSAVCTHGQCIVDQVADGTIDCPCHGSKFSAKDGSVVIGPAVSPLPGIRISVSSGQISTG
jgi:nitrite reductase/ring-hydroxylating ferredoxin subunit